MNKITRILTLLILLAGALQLAPGPASAQTPGIGDVTINYLEAVENEEGGTTVSAYVSVVDVDGSPILGLTPENFSVFEDGTEMPLAEAQPAQDSAAIILSIDTSGTMASLGADGKLAIDSAKEAAASFVSTLAAEDQVAVYSFTDEVVLRQDLSIDHNAAINAINGLNYKDFGHTCLYDAAYKAIKKAAEVPQGRRAVIVLTDGVDETGEGPCSTHTLGDVIEAATELTTKVPVFTVGLGEKIDERELARLASLTGGRGLVAPAGSDLTTMFTTISNQLKKQYLLSYQTQAVSGEHAVVVKVKSGDSQAEDERRVFVPASAAVTTPTPTDEVIITEEAVAEYSILITHPTAEDPIEGEIEIVVDLSQAQDLVRTALLVDNRLLDERSSPPCDRFVLDLEALEPGFHILRVEATDANGYTASDQRELTITAPEPVVEEEPPPVPTPEPLPPETGVNPVAIAACVVVGLIIIGLVLFFVLRRRRAYDTYTETVPWGSSEDNVDIPSVISDDSVESYDDPYKTFDDGEDLGGPSTFRSGSVPPAQLVVIRGLNVIKNEKFPITNTRATIGRSAGGARNDIDIQDRPVSRQHAVITYRGGQFFIEDMDSRYHTFVDGHQVGHDPVLLRDGAEVALGTKTVFRFEIGSGAAPVDDEATMDPGEEDDPYGTVDDLAG